MKAKRQQYVGGGGDCRERRRVVVFGGGQETSGESEEDVGACIRELVDLGGDDVVSGVQELMGDGGAHVARKREGRGRASLSVEGRTHVVVLLQTEVQVVPHHLHIVHVERNALANQNAEEKHAVLHESVDLRMSMGGRTDVNVSTKVDALSSGDGKRRAHLLPTTVIEGTVAPVEGHREGAAVRQPGIGGGHDRNGCEVVVTTGIQIGDRATHEHG